MGLKSRLLVVVSIALSITFGRGTASADASVVWDAVTAVMPADAVGVVRFDVAQMRTTAIYRDLVSKVLGAERKLASRLDTMAKRCKVDFVNDVDDVVIAVHPKNKAAVFAKIRNVNDRKVSACVATVAKADRDSVVTRRTGNIVEYLFKKSKGRFYVGWLTPEVAVVTSEESNRELLADMLRQSNGFVESADGKRLLGAVNTGGLAWGVMKGIPGAFHDVNFQGATASIAGNAGVISVQVRARFGTAQETASLASKANEAIAEVLKKAPAAPAKILRAVRVSAVADELLIAASASEADVSAAVGWATEQH